VRIRVTWWGHATATVEIGGLRLLTDPVLTARVAHVLRRVGGPMPSSDAADADVVVVSHLHADHLHLPSLRRVETPATLVVPHGAGLFAARAWPGSMVEARPGEALAFGSTTLTPVRALHDGHRFPGSGIRAPALGYVIEHGGIRVWFAGDTGWSGDLARLAPVTVALVPIGGWGPTLGPHHLDPEQAAHAVAVTRAAHAVPLHYGTFWPVGLRSLAPTVFTERFRLPGVRFAAAVSRLALPTQVHLLRRGESVTMEFGSG
jgi:L-ascorbate metabolism protein UlaG (beta-lactamase superfamily)